MADYFKDYRYARPLQRRVTKTASFGPFASGTFQNIEITAAQDTSKPDVAGEMAQFDAMVVVLVINSASRGGAETYDFFITGGLQKVVQNTNTSNIGITQTNPLRWDVVHFPQIVAAVSAGTPKILAARVNGIITPETITSASPGVIAVDPAIFDISAPGANQGIKTLTAGMVRHGYWGDHLTHELVIAGGGSPSIDYEIWIAAATL